jgi:hypothetical protein
VKIGVVSFALFLSVFAQAQIKPSFLREYQQEVISKNRAVVFGIKTEAGRMIPLLPEVLEPTADGVVDFVSYLIIAPWLKVKYSKVYVLYSSSKIRETWEEAFSKYHVVDFFSATHGASVDSGEQFTFLYPSSLVSSRKPGQLRLAYTTSCYSQSFRLAVARFDAAAGVGHTGVSASPFVVYRIMRHWAEGDSLSIAIQKAWAKGKKILQTIAPRQVESTEPMVSFTQDLDLNRFNIQSVYSRRAEFQQDEFVIERKASQLITLHGRATL